MRFRPLIFAFLTLCPLCHGGETPVALDGADERCIELALRAIKMSTRDLSFKKDHVESEFDSTLACKFLQRPLELPTYGQSELTNLQAVVSLRTLVDCSLFGGGCRFGVCGMGSASLSDEGFKRNLPEAVRTAVELLYESAQRVRGGSLSAVSIFQLSAFACESLQLEEDKSELDAWDRLGIDTKPAREMLQRGDRLEIQDGELERIILGTNTMSLVTLEFYHLAGVVDAAIEVLHAARDDQAMRQEFQFETDTPLGIIIIGGAGKNVYKDEAFLIIDTGGDDVYENSAGGANGLVDRPISIVIDMAGNDQFVSKRSFSQGSGVFGIGILAVLGSNCMFQAKHLSQGAGFFGCGLLMTGPGKQTFEADTFCQGAGMFGAGILWQRGGDTSYKAGQMAQGFGGVQGVGLVLDENGNDTYTAGGKYPCPWLPGHNFSLSQGFGYGMRPFAGGGIGILCDLKGDDHYEADVYGQGASYWYAVGMLLDAEGNDSYGSYQYCQGAGIHLSSGALIDWNGDDTYKAHAICQGGAHDYSVGMLIDRDGNDRYEGDSTAQGSAINNSFAMLLDRAGDDSYTGSITNASQAAGHDGGRREYGSIALMLDLGGKDSYSQGQGNDAMWTKRWYGAGLDYEAKIWSAPTRRRFSASREQDGRQSGDKSLHSKLTSAALVDPHHPIERLMRVALSDKAEAKVAGEELQKRGVEVLPYLLTRVDSPNVVLRSKVEELIDAMGTNSVPALIAGIDNAKSDEVARICCYFLARFETATNAIPHVLPLLNREKTRATALYTLGHLHAGEVFKPALRALTDRQETVRLRAVQALGRIGDRRAMPNLIRALDDEMWDVRYAAQDALVALGRPSIGALRHAFKTASHRARAHIIGALAGLGDKEALAMAREELRGEDRLVRKVVELSLQQ